MDPEGHADRPAKPERLDGSNGFIAAMIAIPLGAVTYYFSFRGKRIVIGAVQTLYALPTVLIGLLVYLRVSNARQLGMVRMLYMTNAMVFAHVPIAGLTIAGFFSPDKEMKYTILSLNVNVLQAITTLCRVERFPRCSVPLVQVEVR